MTDEPRRGRKASEMKEPVKIGKTTIHPSGMTAAGKKKPRLSLAIIGRGGRPPIKKPRDE